MTLNDLYALSAAGLWIVSTFIVNTGFRELPQERLAGTLAGLNCSLVAGSITIMVVLGLQRLIQPPEATRLEGWLTPMAITAGLFTFPIGTGLYYATTAAYQNTAQIAAQYIKVKPLASILLGVWLLDESIGRLEWFAIGLIVVGIALFFVAGSRSQHGLVPVILGLGTALSWALGEAFVAAASVSDGLLLTAYALFAGTAAMLLVSLPVAARILAAVRWSSLRWFALHGVVSFGLAYWLFFQSIGHIGLTRTVLLTAFWPGASLVVKSLVGRGDKASVVSPAVWLAVMLLLSAAMLQAISQGPESN